MRLSLVGMSGSGKSTWSVKLSEIGFKRFCCDDMIARKLTPELTRSDKTTMALGEWMGFPYEDRYADRESKYLDREIDVMTEILDLLESSEEQAGEDTVIDTTGSVIYTGEDVLKRLRRCTMVVHLSTPPEIQDLMLSAYLENQRPVLWRGLFEKRLDETKTEAMARCYPMLLYTRERLYAEISDVTIDGHDLHRDDFSVDDFLDSVMLKGERP